MRIYMAVDLEGISGVCVFDQTREPTTTHYQDARRLLMDDINAAVAGCFDGGATEVVVEDEHAGGFNFLGDLIDSRVVYLTGKSRPKMSQRENIYTGFDGAILLGYHAMAGTPDGILNHTQSSRKGNRYWYNGRESGEIAQAALRLGHCGVPVVMVSSDDAGCREARDFLGKKIVTVSVKRGVTIEYGFLIPPKRAHEMLHDGACKAMSLVGKLKPFKMKLPIQGRLQFPDKTTADACRPVRGKRVDDHSFEATFDRGIDVLEF